MPFDPKNYEPRHNTWYQGSGIYSGVATLKVAGVVKATGSAEVSWNDVGETSVAIELPPNEPMLAHTLFETDEISLDIATAAGGTFTADRAFVHYNQMGVGPTGSSTRLHLTAARSALATGTSDAPTYWIIPAVNFLADLHYSSECLAKHPLRLYITPEIPQELDVKDKFIAKHIANAKERLIPFTFDGQPALSKSSTITTRTRSFLRRNLPTIELRH